MWFVRKEIFDVVGVINTERKQCGRDRETRRRYVVGKVAVPSGRRGRRVVVVVVVMVVVAGDRNLASCGFGKNLYNI